MITTLAELLAPVSTSEFLEALRASRRLLIRAVDATRMASLLSWQDIDSLMAKLAIDHKLLVMRDGVIVPPQLYSLGEDSRFNARAFHDLMAQGVSIVVDSIDDSISQIGRLAAAIERELGIAVQINGYLSFSKGGAFKPHWDRHDVLAVQVYGRKQWRIWNAEIAHPIDKTDILKVDTSLPPDQVIELTPGDVIFIPRGEAHSAAVSIEHSVHLTISLSSLTGLDFIDHFRKEAAKNLLLRMNLPRHSSEEEARKHEANLKRQLHQLVDAASITNFLGASDLRRRPFVQTALSGALPQIDDVLFLTLRRRIPLSDVAPDGAPQPITIGGEVFRLAPASIGIMRWLFDHDAATRRELYVALSPHYEQASIDAALRELLRFGFLAVCHAD
jgi:ribosomal protein L16 Arg81 hydroxylase